MGTAGLAQPGVFVVAVLCFYSDGVLFHQGQGITCSYKASCVGTPVFFPEHTELAYRLLKKSSILFSDAVFFNISILLIMLC